MCKIHKCFGAYGQRLKHRTFKEGVLAQQLFERLSIWPLLGRNYL